MDWPKPTIFDARNTSPWMVQPSAPLKPDFADDEDLKKAFGIELGRGLDSFKAGMIVFNEEMPKALWASIHWAKDPIVIASRDAYALTLKKAVKPLDKEELLAEVLETSKIAPEFKDKAALLKLYSEIAGFTGKIAIDASTNNINNTQNNIAKIVLVKGQEPPQEIKSSNIENTKSKILNNGLPQLKLVGGSS